MKKIRMLIIGLLLLSPAAFAKTLLVVGDSLSAAYGIPAESGWVALLDKELSDVEVVNASISGETTSGGLTRLEALLDRHQPEYMVLELGANDGLRGSPVAQIEENLSAMVAMAKTSGAQVLILGIQLPPNYGRRYTKRFYQVFEQVADSSDSLRVPFFLEGVATKPQLMQSDRLHPTAQAQPIILQNVLPSVQELLQR